MPPDPHPPTADLARLGVDDLLARLADGSLTSESLTAALLDRIVAVDDPSGPVGLASIAAVAPDALDQARARDADRRGGGPVGPLCGIPVVVKDNVEAAGLPGTAGATSLAGRPARDAPLVTRLRAAGAVVLAATNLSEWANLRSSRSTSGWSATGGLVGNPWALDRSAGGSSSGSGAAVAAGLAPLAVGTETDGSIVCPSSLNGVVGLKPTVGAVPTAGVVPLSASQDSPGPLGRSVADVARLFAVLADRDPVPPDRPPALAVATTWTTGHPATDAVLAAVVAALRDAGESVVDREVAVPGGQEFADELTVLLAETRDDLGAYLAGRPGPGPRSVAEVLAHERSHAEVELPFFGHDLLERAEASGGRAGAGYAEARARNLAWARETCLGPALEGADVLVAAAYGPAWKSDLVAGDHSGAVAGYATTPAAIAGWPVASVPVGLVLGLPVGMALIARPGGEGVLLEAARRVEAVVAATAPLPPPSWCPPVRG